MQGKVFKGLFSKYKALSSMDQAKEGWLHNMQLQQIKYDGKFSGMLG
jgi:hypothetical protein